MFILRNDKNYYYTKSLLKVAEYKLTDRNVFITVKIAITVQSPE